MAIDKSRTPTWMKVVLLLLAGAFVFGVGGSSLMGFCSEPPTATNTTGTSVDTSATLVALARSFTPTVEANEATLKKTPKDYDVLVLQANTYSNWPSAILQSAGDKATQQQQLALAEAAAPMSAKGERERVRLLCL